MFFYKGCAVQQEPTKNLKLIPYTFFVHIRCYYIIIKIIENEKNQSNKEYFYLLKSLPKQKNKKRIKKVTTYFFISLVSYIRQAAKENRKQKYKQTKILIVRA